MRQDEKRLSSMFEDRKPVELTVITSCQADRPYGVHVDQGTGRDGFMTALFIALYITKQRWLSLSREAHQLEKSNPMEN